MRIRKGIQTTVIAVALAAALASAAAAQQDTAGSARRSSGYDHGNIGIGVIFGEPTGLSAKLWTTQNTGFDLGAAWSWSGDGHFHIHADYLFHNFSLLDVEKGSLPVYMGVGGRILFRDNADDKIGIRFVVGLEYFFEDWPLAVFAEVVPILDLAPSTDGEINGGLGVRFYF